MFITFWHVLLTETQNVAPMGLGTIDVRKVACFMVSINIAH